MIIISSQHIACKKLLFTQRYRSQWTLQFYAFSLDVCSETMFLLDSYVGLKNKWAQIKVMSHMPKQGCLIKV